MRRIKASKIKAMVRDCVNRAVRATSKDISDAKIVLDLKYGNLWLVYFEEFMREKEYLSIELVLIDIVYRNGSLREIDYLTYIVKETLLNHDWLLI